MSNWNGFVPKRCFLTEGAGTATTKLVSFEMALRSAGISQVNLVRVSSIFPPNCKIIPAKQGVKELHPGSVIFCVLSENATNEPNRLIAASVGLAIPKDRSLHGYISEHHSYGENERKAGDFAEDLAAQMLATTLGVGFDPEKSWDERKEIWKISGEIVRTTEITASAIGNREGKWSTVVAAMVFLP